MKVDIMIHGQAKKKGKPLLLVSHPKLKEPKWVQAASLKAADKKGALVYDALVPIPRKVTMTKALAEKLGIA